MTGLCAVRVGMLESKRTVHLDLARSNADVFLLASGRSGCRAPIERVDVEHAKAAKDRAPAHLRGAIGCHRSVHAVGARKLSCPRRFSSKLRYDRCDCSRSSFTQVMPHTQLPYTIQTRARAMNGAAHRERWVGRDARGPPHLRAVTHRFLNLRDRDSPSPLLKAPLAPHGVEYSIV
jgi:hypothetical protein